MPELTAEQRQRVQGISKSASDRVDERLDRVENGEVVDHKIPSSYYGIAMKLESAGVCHFYEDDTQAARAVLARAAAMYRRAVDAARSEPPYANAYRRCPMTLVEALYVATLAGEFGVVREIATEIIELEPEDGADEAVDGVAFETDKYYLATCLAGAVLGDVDRQAMQELDSINAKKDTPDSLYGDGIIEFARGIASEEPEHFQAAIRSVDEYHELTLNGENVVDLIMAKEATALYILARRRGYDVQVDSEFIPDSLVEACLSDHL